MIFRGKEQSANFEPWDEPFWKTVVIAMFGKPERQGTQVGTYSKIGPEDPARGAEYIPIVFGETDQPHMIHKTRVRGK
jgi:hypothetical protein